MSEKVFLNDRLVDIDKAAVSVTDSGFSYGAGLFETMRCCCGVVFALEDHLERLFASAKTLAINAAYDKKFITDAIYETLRANSLTDARLRLTLTSGSISQADQDQPAATLLITATQMTGYPPEYYDKGVLVVLCPYRQNIFEPICGHKTTNYFSRMLALNLAHRKRAAEALWFTVDDRLAEGCISNVFIVKDSALYTPHAKTPVLPGVARKTVFKIATQKSIKVEEKDLYIADCLDADEVFLTNVIMQIMPVSCIEKHTVGNGNVGKVTAGLIKSFDEFVKNSCGQNK
ncbi:MAG: aminotransferase class IV [Planctomycetota bacterium]|jgi:branched-chain amino acid aminotransferase